MKTRQYFPKPYDHFGINVKVELNLSSYATKTDSKNATGIDISKLAGKSDLASLKAEVDKIDRDKLNTVPVYLSKLSNVGNNEDVKKTVYDQLVTKVNNIDTSRFVFKTKYNKDKSDFEKKSLILVDLKNTIIPKLLKQKAKYLVLVAQLTSVENKIPDVGSLVKKKTDYDAEILDNKFKYFTTGGYNKFTNEKFDLKNKKDKLLNLTLLDS